MTEQLMRKDDIVKDHTKYTHTITMIYPHANVKNMKKAWRVALETGHEWLESFDDKLKSGLEVGYAKLDEEVEGAKKEIEEGTAITDEELFKKYKKQHVDYLAGLQDFIKDLPKRRADFELAVKKELETYKAKVVEDLKSKRDALKLWAEK